MLIGAMNFPGRSVLKEIHRIHEDGFDFVDLTIEPPAAWTPDGKEVGRLLGDLGLGVVGHTAWYIPHSSPFEELRTAAFGVFKRGFECFADAGVELVNVHPDQRVPLHSLDRLRARNADSIAELCEIAAGFGITVMVENLDRQFSAAEDMLPIFEKARDARFHLDVGHANLNLARGQTNRTEEFLGAFGDRLAHVHLSDNRGGPDDLHLPLGAGMIDWKQIVRLLKRAGYDGTITLEVFSREREYLRMSRKLLLQWWSEVKA